jgi:hypothetical protein
LQDKLGSFAIANALLDGRSQRAGLTLYIVAAFNPDVDPVQVSQLVNLLW